MATNHSQGQFVPNFTEAKQFLSVVASEGNITFQTFGDKKKRTDRRLSKILHGSIEEKYKELDWLNKTGAGVFFMVNRGDGKGRKAENVIGVRAIFIDLDEEGASKLEEIYRFKTGGPRIVVESSPGKYHVYWLIDGDLPLDCFSLLQKHFAGRFGGDSAVSDLPRVMRVPGFYHQKGTPFQTRIIYDNSVAQPLPVGILIEKAKALFSSEETVTVGSRNSLNSDFQVIASPQGLTPQLLDALQRINPHPYAEWLKIGMALHHETGGNEDGLAQWIKWSSKAENFDEAECRVKYASFGKYTGDKVTAGTIFDLAKKEGWSAPLTEFGDDEATIQHLAAFDPLKYDRQRKEVADSLGVRATTLDKMVQAIQKGEEANSGLVFNDPEPWPDPVNGADLLTEIAATVKRFIICQPETAQAVALWVSMTWYMDVVQVAPLAVITAPEKRCGKSQLLFLLGRMVYRPLTASNISTAALFRTIDAWRPTMLVDEADSFMKENEDMRGLLNSGHTRDGAYIIRVVGDDHEPKRFNTWGAKALAGIGRIADTLMDRAIILELRRKLPHENVDRLRYAEPDLFQTLREKLCRFAEDHQENVRLARPDLPEQLNDRAQDNWEPLLAIADIAGGQWPSLARAAALKLSGATDSTLTIGVELLSDIREIFETERVDRISTAQLIVNLCRDEEKPWATYNRGLPIKPRQIANRLSGYGIKSNTIRIGTYTAKGYRMVQFTDTFSRYLDSTPSSCVTKSQSPANRALGVSEGECCDVTNILKETQKMARGNGCDLVTDKLT